MKASLQLTVVGIAAYLAPDSAARLADRWFRKHEDPQGRNRFRTMRRRFWRSAALVALVFAAVVATVAARGRPLPDAQARLRLVAAFIALTASLARAGWSIQSLNGTTVAERVDRGMFVVSQLGATSILLLALLG